MTELGPHLRHLHRQMKAVPQGIKENPQLVQLLAEHQKWLSDPMTQKVIQLLVRRLEKVSERLCNAAIAGTITDSSVRVIAVEQAELSFIYLAIADSSSFIESLTNVGLIIPTQTTTKQ